MSLKKQALYLSFGRFAAFPIVFFIPLLLVRKLSPEEFGYYKQLFLLFYLMAPLVELGVINSLYYFIPTYKKDKNLFVRNTLFCLSSAAITVSLILYLFPNVVSFFISGSSSLEMYIPLIGLFLSLWIVADLWEALLVIEKRSGAVCLLLFISELLKGGAIVVPALLTNDLFVILVALNVFGFLKLAVFLFWLFRNNLFTPGLPSMRWLKIQLKYAFPLVGANLLNTGLVNAHNYVVSIKNSAEMFAIYSVGCFQFPFIEIIAASVGRVLLIRLSEKSRDGKESEMVSLLSKSFEKLSICFVPLAVFLFLRAEDFIVVLYTDLYIQSVPIFRIFVFIIFVNVLRVEFIPRGINRMSFMFTLNLLTLIVAFIGALGLQQLFGVNGAAFSVLIALLFRKISVLLMFKKHVNCSLISMFPVSAVIRILMITFFAYLISTYIIQLFIDVEIKTLVFLVDLFSYSLVVFFMFWVFGVFDRDDKVFMHNIVKRLIR